MACVIFHGLRVIVVLWPHGSLAVDVDALGSGHIATFADAALGPQPFTDHAVFDSCRNQRSAWSKVSRRRRLTWSPLHQAFHLSMNPLQTLPLPGCDARAAAPCRRRRRSTVAVGTFTKCTNLRDLNTTPMAVSYRRMLTQTSSKFSQALALLRK